MQGGSHYDESGQGFIGFDLTSLASPVPASLAACPVAVPLAFAAAPHVVSAPFAVAAALPASVVPTSPTPILPLPSRPSPISLSALLPRAGCSK